MLERRVGDMCCWYKIFAKIVALLSLKKRLMLCDAFGKLSLGRSVDPLAKAKEHCKVQTVPIIFASSWDYPVADSSLHPSPSREIIYKLLMWSLLFCLHRLRPRPRKGLDDACVQMRSNRVQKLERAQ